MYGLDGKANIPHREWLSTFDRILKDVKLEQRGLVGAKVHPESNFFVL